MLRLWRRNSWGYTVLRRNDLQLRTITEEDSELLLRWRNSDRIRAVMFSDHIITADEHAAWISKTIKAPVPGILMFEYQGKPLGVVTIDRVDMSSSRCYWGFYLGEESHPAQSGSALGCLGLEYLFTTLGMRKVCGECLALNEPGVRFHTKMGFTLEGRFVRHHLKNGNYVDVLSFALFREDWLRERARLERLCFEEGKDI